jgi:aspartyl-tRNA(Asn)/glutamyl-tRNA(Gln) amidotransferase subunit A
MKKRVPIDDDRLPLDGLIIGISKEWLEFDQLEVECRILLNKILNRLDNLQVRLKLFSLPMLLDCPKNYYNIACAESSSCLARYNGMEWYFEEKRLGKLDNGCDFEDQVKKFRTNKFNKVVNERISRGHLLLTEKQDELNSSLRYREELKTSLDHLFRIEGFDFILGPTSSGCAPKIDEPVNNELADIFNIPANLVGLPSISLSLKQKDKKGFNIKEVIGTQLISQKYEDFFLLRSALELEKEEF